MNNNETHKKFAIAFMYTAVAIATAYLIFNYLWGVIVPFLVAYALAECFKPIVKYAENHKRFPKRTVVLLVLFLASASVIMLIYAAARELAREVFDLADTLRETITRIRDDENYASGIIDKICSIVPFFDLHDKLWEIRPEIDDKLLGAVLSSADKIAGGLWDFAGGAISFLPDAVLTFVVVLISTYYFAVDRVRINCFFLGLFPAKTRPRLKKIKDDICGTAINYLRAYGLIFFITFLQLLTAFWLMGLRYAFVIALVTAIVDILPVLGTGTVLVPWSIIELVSGNIPIGIGLLATYAVITVVRQIIEPKIIGKFIGLPPLAALASMYIGLKLIGLPGLIIMPLATIIALRAVKGE